MMPASIAFVDSSSVTRIDSRLSFTFEANLNDLPSDEFVSPVVHKEPRGCGWTWRLSTAGDTSIRLACVHSDGRLPVGALGDKVPFEMSLELLRDSEPVLLAVGRREPEVQPRADGRQTYVGYNWTIKREQLLDDHPWFGHMIDEPQRYRVTATFRADTVLRSRPTVTQLFPLPIELDLRSVCSSVPRRRYLLRVGLTFSMTGSGRY